jgi:hypothetical protein
MSAWKFFCDLRFTDGKKCSLVYPSLGLGNNFRQVPSKSQCKTMGHIKAGSS